ncbi:hypothetical protein GGR52DRAFT_591865 [Hypoxylon sp. FL1284]|nr:hypothetical protein GGR52DRAFT_591865 [Hypoxylon sp. FL1284]
MSDVKDVHSPLLTPSTKTAVPQLGTPSAPKPSKAPASPQKPTNLTPVNPAPVKSVTNLSWGAPAGLPVRGPNDENLVIFRRALGINSHLEARDAGTLEEGRKSAVGVYRSVLRAQSRKATGHAALTAFLYLCYFAQVVVGAALTALGPSSGRHETAVTVLGAVNTALAGVLALIRGSGQPQRLERDRVGFRRLQDWVEETEALLAVGVVGRDRREVGLLVESAFKRYNAAMASVENNSPDYYVNHPADGRPADDNAAGKPLKPNAP